MDLLVVYDIAVEDREDGRRLRAVAKICEGYGVRVQDSVFEMRLSDVGVLNLRHELEDTIDSDRDSVHFYRLHGNLNDARTVIGRSIDHEIGSPWIF